MLAALDLCCCVRAFFSSESGGCSPRWRTALSEWRLLSVVAHSPLAAAVSPTVGLQVCAPQWLWLTDSRVLAWQPWCTGLVVSQHAGSSWTRDQTCVPALVGGFFTTEPPGKLDKYFNFYETGTFLEAGNSRDQDGGHNLQGIPFL